MPLAFTETVETYSKLEPNRIIAFDFKVWLRPQPRKKNKPAEVRWVEHGKEI